MVKTSKHRLYFLIPFVWFVALFSLSSPVQASDVSANVTSLTVSPAEIADGGKTTVRFTFDEHVQKIKSGDTIKVTWQNSGTVYGSGFSQTVRLTIQGTYIGDLVISDGQALVTFTDGVNDLQNITGWGEFEIQGRNLTQTSGEHTGSFVINSGGQSTSLTVKKGAAGTSSVFYYKTGDMQTDDTEHVRWFLNINNDRVYVDGDVRIEDEIQSGQTLDIDSFYITVTGFRNEVYAGSDALARFAADFAGSVISADAKTGKITVLIPGGWVSLNSISIMYLTKIDNPDQKAFENYSKAWYQENGKEAVNGQEFNYTVANVAADGGADGDKTTTTTVTESSTTSQPTSTTVTESPTTSQSTTTVTESSTTSQPTSTTVTESSTTSQSTTTVTESPTTSQSTTTVTESSSASQPNTPQKSVDSKGKKAANKLPTTGDKSDKLMTAVGLVTVWIAILGVVLYPKLRNAVR
ncbi:Gamma-glutamyltranspeptidase [Streptococcus chenjunshii]|uniref:Gamma-glutamyltranspeptidase n=1 Tax=Streptococcus chenjunshii TaxID=2173853 RepID=A0A372KPE4_9STRE|nr:LPXTG cell wall anchor domain-containing protein [Streptococcus chenjunshii]AXQ78159.1 Gamma-glutamyltranspeptidase [Streptococcus chenjunshii]RFU50696.1 Gamma-glutamyltranspeptidase [Streptococcus chenjunshii]RFU53468.1 Gamma-glutamyltranspeptidase [Streptococcus chenjunshii]